MLGCSHSVLLSPTQVLLTKKPHQPTPKYLCWHDELQRPMWNLKNPQYCLMGLIQGYKVKGADLQWQIEGVIWDTSVGCFLCSSAIIVHFVCFLRVVSGFCAFEESFQNTIGEDIWSDSCLSLQRAWTICPWNRMLAWRLLLITLMLTLTGSPPTKAQIYHTSHLLDLQRAPILRAQSVTNV